jgi:hypothetical protein
MREVLKTRDEPWLGPVRLDGAADDEGMERVRPRTRLDSPAQLTVLNCEDANVVPVSQRAPRRSACRSRSAIRIPAWP